jgi:hypothetical protein
MGELRYSSTILDLGTRWKWVVSFMFLPFYPRERAPGTHWIWGLVGPRAGLEAVEWRRVLHCRESNPRRPDRSPSLCRLNYPDSQQTGVFIIIIIIIIIDASSSHTECVIQPNTLNNITTCSAESCALFTLPVTSKAWNNTEYQRNMKVVVTQLFSVFETTPWTHWFIWQ